MSEQQRSQIMSYNHTLSTTINNKEINFCIDLMEDGLYELSFWIEGSMQRQVGNKQCPSITRWVLTQFKAICKWADENNYVLIASAYDEDEDYPMRVKAYSKYMNKVSNNQFIYGNANNTHYEFLAKPISTDIDFSFMD